MNKHFVNFIKKSNQVHNNRYDYSKVVYRNSKTKVIITCPVHGDFEQTPNSHMQGTRCPKCAGNFKFSTKEWIKAAESVHGNKYDYSKSEYINAKTKIKINCQHHGEFEQTSSSHLIGHGCVKCGSELRGLAQASNVSNFVEKANLVHFGRYNYTKVNYTNNKTKIIIICPEHGKFLQTPNNHLHGDGCPICKIQKLAIHNTRDEQGVIKEFHKVHGYVYDYSKVKYVKLSTKVDIICKEHGVFQQCPNNHIQGQGCPECAVTGFDKSRSAILYYLKIILEDGKELYKLGITNRSINERFSLTELQKIEIIKQKEYKNGYDAYNKEQDILKQYKKFKYIGPPILDSGNTELFTVDIRNTQPV
jgi:uncharacterized C2H2 Zn-finger protein